MSNEQTGTDLSAGQAVPSLNARGSNDFDALISGNSGGGQQQQQQEPAVTTKHEGTKETPPLETVTPKKTADAGQGEQQQGQQGQQQGQQQQQQSQQAATPPGIDPAILAQIVETATKAAQAGVASRPDTTAAAQAQVKKDVKDLTQEEFNQKYGIEAITPATIQAILDQDPAKGAATLNRILTRNIGSAVLMAKDVFDRQLEALRAEYSPHVSFLQNFQREQREAKLEADFYKSYADLQNEKPLVKEMQDAIFGRIASGQMKPFDKPEDALKAVAEASRAVLARMNKQAGAAGGSGQTQSQQQQGQGSGGSQRQMTAASTAGQSGAGKTAGPSDEEKIFGKDYV